LRKIDYLVVHCTATSQDTEVHSIVKYWRDVLGWRNPGYHYIVDPSGFVFQLHPEDKVSNGVKGYNSNSIHISYIGGKTKDDRTEDQKAALYAMLEDLRSRYPNAQIQGHRDFPNVAKACPQFDAREEYADI